MAFDENADPTVELETAINEAKKQHTALKQQAASVMANAKRMDMRVDKKLDELESVSANARQAVLMADEASKTGDTERATEMTRAAESFADRLVRLEAEVEDLKKMQMGATEAANEAKAAVVANETQLKKKLTEKSALLSKLDQAKLQEKMNDAMSSLSETIGEDVPTIDEVSAKIEDRLAKAKGMAELQGDSVEASMLEVESAAANVEAQARLSEIRSQLGIGPEKSTESGSTQQAEPATAAGTSGGKEPPAGSSIPDPGETPPATG